jgi:hypothetical protein
MIARSDTRNLELDQLAKILQDQAARKLDVIAGAGAIGAVGGRLVLEGTEPQLGADGVTMTAGSYAVNDVANTGLPRSSVSRRRTCGACTPSTAGCTTRTSTAGWHVRTGVFWYACSATRTAAGRCGRSCPTGIRGSTTSMC